MPHHAFIPTDEQKHNKHFQCGLWECWSSRDDPVFNQLCPKAKGVSHLCSSVPKSSCSRCEEESIWPVSRLECLHSFSVWYTWHIQTHCYVLVIQSANHVTVKLCRYRSRVYVNDHRKHQNGEEKWLSCLCQMGRIKYFRNCWYSQIFTHDSRTCTIVCLWKKHLAGFSKRKLTVTSVHQ